MTENNCQCGDAPKMNNEFAVHRLNEEGMHKSRVIQLTFDNCLNSLEQVCAPGREFAIAKTKLEEACFFAKKAMAVNPGNQQQ